MEYSLDKKSFEGEAMITEKNEGLYHSIKLNRPDARNAFNPEMIHKLTQAFKATHHDKNIRAITIEGEGSVFCAGADLNWMQSLVDASVDINQSDAEKLHGLFQAIWNCEVPVIAVVQGAAYGGALGLMAVADYVICDEKAQLCFSEVKLGIAPAVISEYVLKKCNFSHAAAWMMLGVPFTAIEAQVAGLVHRVVAARHLQEEKEKFLKNVTEAGPEAVRSVKKLLREIPQIKDKEIMERTTSLIAFLRASPEGQEGLKSFLEKRQPSWRNA
jgi:methylglutaconyl-CoA hydratase